MELKVKKEYHGKIMSSAKLGGKNIVIDANDSTNFQFYFKNGLDFIFETDFLAPFNLVENKWQSDTNEELAEPTDALDKAEKEVSKYRNNKKKNDSNN
jgi:hypothetical protein